MLRSKQFPGIKLEIFQLHYVTTTKALCDKLYTVTLKAVCVFNNATICPSFTTIKYGVVQFKRDLTTCQGDHRSSRPNEVTTQKWQRKSANWYWIMLTKSARVSRHGRHFKKCCTSHVE